MVKRGWLTVVVTELLVAGLLVAGCARPGTRDGSTEVVTPPTRRPAVVLPTAGMAACFDRKIAASPPAVVGVPRRESDGEGEGTGDAAGDAFERNQRANNMFRERAELPIGFHAAAQPCVDKVRAALDQLQAESRFDEKSVEAALRSAGLADAYARKPGRLDLGSHSGVVFAASPGVGCIVGHHGPDSTEVEFGGMVADGGCLVAAD